MADGHGARLAGNLPQDSARRWLMCRTRRSGSLPVLQDRISRLTMALLGSSSMLLALTRWVSCRARRGGRWVHGVESRRFRCGRGGTEARLHECLLRQKLMGAQVERAG